MSQGRLNVISLTSFVETLGEQVAMAVLRDYSCPQNTEVSDFLRGKALQSARLSKSVTYLVADERNGSILGYFTLMIKPYTVRPNALNSRNRRLFERFAEYDEEKKTYTVAVYLIAQLGKNFAIEGGRRITGAQLMELALMKLRASKDLVGGKLVFVERESALPKLKDFYTVAGFKSWNERYSKKDNVTYDQMFMAL